MTVRQSLYKLLCVAVLVLTISSCGDIKKPEFRSVKNFKVDSLGIIQSKVRLEVIYFNPNSFGVKLKETHCEVFIDSMRLGQFTQHDIINVKANSDFTIPLTGVVNIKDVIKNPILSFLGKEFLINVDGNTMVGKAGFFRKYPVHYEGRHHLDFLK